MKKHNGVISIWKFLFSFMIVLYHIAFQREHILFGKGYIAVEFFFIVSGFLLAKSINKNVKQLSNNNLGNLTLQFIWRKLKIVLPYIIMCYILNVVIFYFFSSLSGYRIFNTIWDLLLLRMSGIQGVYLNTPAWYISAMLLSMFIIYPLYMKKKSVYSYILAPLIILFGLGYLSQSNSNLNAPFKWIGWTYHGTLRAFVELNIGIVLFEISGKLKKVDYTFFGRLLLTIIEFICFVTPFLVTTFIKRSSNYDFLMLLMISIGVLIAFSEKTLTYKVCCNRLFYFLEKLSLPIFLSHCGIRQFLFSQERISTMPYYQSTLIYVDVVLLVSLSLYLINKLLKKYNYFGSFWEKILVRAKE